MPGSSRLTRVLSVRLPVEVFARLEELAGHDQVSMSMMGRRLLVRGVGVELVLRGIDGPARAKVLGRAASGE